MTVPPIDPQSLISLGLAAFAGLVWLIARWRGSEFPYVAAGGLLTAAERAFFQVLRQAVANDYHLFAKVRLADLIEVQNGLSYKRRSRAFNRICAKHADFVACDPRTFRIVGVIELDDRSHRAAVRQDRDRFMDAALAAAQIPVLRIPAQRSYSAAALRAAIAEAFN